MEKLFRNRTVLVLIIFALSLAVRLSFVLLTYDAEHPMATGQVDDSFFHLSAVHLLEGKGYIFDYGYPDVRTGHPTAWMPPVYSLFIAAVYAVFGPSPLALYIIQAIIAALCSVLIYYITLRLFDNDKIALLAGLVSVILPDLFYSVSRYQKETLYLLFLCLLVWLFLKFIQNPTIKQWVGISALVGVISLTRSEFMVFTLLFPLTMVFYLSGIKKWLQYMIIYGLIVIVFVGAWGFRNKMVMDKWVFTTNGGFFTLCCANNDHVTGHALQPLAGQHFEFMDMGLDELEQEEAYKEIVLQWVKDDPMKFVKLVPHKLWGLLGPVPYSQSLAEKPKYIFNLLLTYNIIFVIFYYLGFFTTFKMWRKLVPVYILIIQTLVTCVLFYGNIRLRSTIAPFLLIFAVYAFYRFVYTPFANRFRNRTA